METYKAWTLRQLMEYIETHKEDYPKGLDTVIMSGDFEENYTHEKHEPQVIESDEKYGNILCLGYEMHEDYDIYWRNDED